MTLALNISFLKIWWKREFQYFGDISGHKFSNTLDIVNIEVYIIIYRHLRYEMRSHIDFFFFCRVEHKFTHKVDFTIHSITIFSFMSCLTSRKATFFFVCALYIKKENETWYILDDYTYGFLTFHPQDLCCFCIHLFALHLWSAYNKKWKRSVGNKGDGECFHHSDQTQFFNKVEFKFNVAALELFVINRPFLLTDVEFKSKVESVVGVFGRMPIFRIPKIWGKWRRRKRIWVFLRKKFNFSSTSL